MSDARSGMREPEARAFGRLEPEARAFGVLEPEARAFGVRESVRERAAARARRASVALGAAAAATLLSACTPLAYYTQSVTGHLAILQSARPVDDWLADPATPEPVRQRLLLAREIRDYASRELHEPDNTSYRRYAALGRPAAVWNVVAAPELSLQAKTWCYAVVGCVAYRGYYDQAEAERLGEALRREGYDVSVYPVPAYSTLGKLPAWDWFADPLLDTFIRQPDVELARLVFHELAHQIAFAPGDTEFNESFATAVEQLGSERWLLQHGTEAQRQAAAASDARRADFRALGVRFRATLQAIYTGTDDDATKRRRKAEAYAALRVGHEQIKRERWGGYTGYDAWIARANNASFALSGQYTDLVPAFRALFERTGGDWPRFHADVRRIAALKTPAERRAALAP